MSVRKSVMTAAELWLGVLFVSLLLLPPFPFPIGNAGGHIAPLTAVLGVPAGTIRLLQWQRNGGRIFRGLSLWILIFFAVLATSTAFAALYSGWAIALGSLARVLLFGIGVAVFLFTFADPEKERPDPLRLAYILFWIALAGGAFACIDFYFQFHVPARFAMQVVWVKSSAMRRAQGVFYESGTLGSFCVFFLTMVLAAAFPLRGPRIWPARVLFPVGFVLLTALILSSSRASVVALATAACALAFLRRAGVRAIVTAVLASGAVVTAVRIALPAFWSNYWFRLTASAKYVWLYPNEVLSGRLTNWKILIEFLERHPWTSVFGIGYKTIPYTNYIGSHVVADNTWLSLLVETGIAGVLAFGALNVAIFRTAYRASRSQRPDRAFFGAWFFCFWCGEMFQMLTADAITYWRLLPVYFWVLATAARDSDR